MLIEASKLSRISRRFLQFARKRCQTDESLGAAYRRTVDACLEVWLAKDGNDGSKWLRERSHALPILADGTRQAPDAELDFVISAVARKDRNRAMQASASVRAETHVMGDAPRPRVAFDAKNPFVNLVPKSVREEMGVAS